ncbi:MAG: Asp-tRNA(Asn)/Glu-tRNA(Gln) amidotransferase subunit GatC [Bacteroidota bacterium]
MQIDRPLLLRLEELARLELSEDERQRIQLDLQNILKMVEKLEELDASDVEPLVYVNEEVSALREDEIKNQVSPAAALANAPDQDGRHFRVPKVLKSTQR